MNSRSMARGSRDKDLVGFVVDDVQYAVEISRVREIINPRPIIDLPHAPPEVLGVADYRGQVIPIVSLRLSFGLPSISDTRRTKWIVVDLPENPVGMAVDAVTEVFGGGPEARGLPESGLGKARAALKAAHKTPKGLTFVIDADRVVARARGIDSSLVPPSRTALGAGGNEWSAK